MGSLTIVGLGPGDASLLTVEARDALARSAEVWLRTARHPTVAGLPAGPRYASFDELYDRLDSFEAVYDAIVGRVLGLAAQPSGVVYAVPGHPLVGEATVRGLIERAPEAGLEVRLVAGLSFVDTATAALGIDPLADGLLVLDALALGGHRRLLTPERPTLIGQLYDRRTATQAKLALLESYPPEHRVRVVRASGTAEAAARDVVLAELDRGDAFDHLTTLYVPPLALTANVRSFEGVRAIVARLRAPDGGCPWDLEQTHETLKRFLLEEAYEALDALDAGEPHRVADELGDLLMQVLLHAQLAEDEGAFAIEDVLGAIGAKLVRRHPHVFGETAVSGAEDVVRNWDVLKKEERGDQPLLDAVPLALPALAQAQAVQSRAAKAGLADPSTKPPGDAIAALGGAALTRDALGDVLFALVAHARSRDIDAEEALRLAVRRFRRAVAAAERAAAPGRP
ncbi:MAG: nucleoside triphosphate pyrophosphohydrolase [Dehalococcoidia bacterium]|nr:nucleoside triphosphate pyrophosphohydrolase [Dehalococcoidia bacterium]